MARSEAQAVRVRDAVERDLRQVIEIDAGITGLRKPAYWRGVLVRYAGARRRRRLFLVADSGRRVEGFAIGEVRDWEYGMPPCGWVFAIGVRPQARLRGIASRLLGAIEEAFRGYGVHKVRTLLARDNLLVLSFFRSQGMMAAPFLTLEKDLV